MDEQIINFETSKLAKEKGFDLYCKYFYTTEDGICQIDLDGEYLAIFDNNLLQIAYRYDCNGDFWYDEETEEFFQPIKYNAPTQSLLQRWLREKHNIDIQLLGLSGDYYVGVNKGGIGCSQYYYPNKKTYEETLEIGLIESLKRIKL